MKAAIVSAKGQTPSYHDFPEPQADDQHVIVTVKAAALSQLTKSRAAGTHYSAEGQFPFIAGVDGTGYLADGQPVYFLAFTPPWGSMAEKTRVPGAAVVPFSPTLDLAEVAALANPGMSSWAALTRRAQLRRGETVLINGATGASGGLAVRIARYLGAGKIIVTGRNPDALHRLLTEGADIALPLDTLAAKLPALMAGGIDVVLDYLWGQSALDIMTAAVTGGDRALRFVQIGSLSGENIALHSKLLRASGLTLMGSGLGSVSNRELIASVGELLDAATKTDFTVPSRTVPLAGVNQAWTEESNRQRIVFTL
ncbi:zinc-binding alcohol dehydrogenase family protein [Shimwellia pseudoproteus]|uniref:quinone oxidoreductase family protein n=1 Tax=Shimwellia pseudoproteus TaxID=570012 RepID=UPI0018EB1474|nr:zinc-binding alcohol dehydrogenase family protein [Shimwellia pseudoproteus]MBJ3815147.1 zinc-binding alcohol dehydrogenase family protein [Shimwellia pseudoproteus]